MRHSRRECAVCHLSPDDRRFLTNLMFWGEPEETLRQDFSLPSGGLKDHFLGTKRWNNYQGVISSLYLPLFENAWALFWPREGHNYDDLLRQRLGRLIERIDQTTIEGNACALLATAFSTDGADPALSLFGLAFCMAYDAAMGLDFSKVPADEVDLIGHHLEKFLPKHQDFQKNVKLRGHAYTTLAVILHLGESDPNITDDALLYQYADRQLALWVFFRLWQTRIGPKLANAKFAEQNLLKLALGQMIQRETNELDKKIVDDGGDIQQEGLKGLKRSYLSQMKAWTSSWDHKQELLGDINIGISRSLSERNFKTAGQLLEALESGKLNLVWRDGWEEMIYGFRLLDAKKRTPNAIFAEFNVLKNKLDRESQQPDQIGTRTVLIDGAENTVKIYAPPEELPRQPDLGPIPSPDELASASPSPAEMYEWNELAKLVVLRLPENECKDELNEFIVKHILRECFNEDDKVTLKELAAMWKATTGRVLSKQTMWNRRKKLVLPVQEFIVNWKDSKRLRKPKN